jgi:hypothetical protein
MDLELRDLFRRESVIRENRTPSGSQQALDFIDRAVLRHGRSPISCFAAFGGGDDIYTDIAHDPDGARPSPMRLGKLFYRMMPAASVVT